MVVAVATVAQWLSMAVVVIRRSSSSRPNVALNVVVLLSNRCAVKVILVSRNGYGGGNRFESEESRFGSAVVVVAVARW